MTLADSTFKSSSDKADALNKLFASVFLPHPQNPCFPPSNTVPVTPTEFSDVSVEEVCRLLNNLSTSKATGPDGISARLLKECSEVLAPSLTALFNKSIAIGKVPADWKYANIVPVPKNNKTHIVSNYRPISLLSLVILCKHCTISKRPCIDVLVFKHIFSAAFSLRFQLKVV